MSGPLARTLVILRHARGEAHDPARDHSRRLSQEGRWQAEWVGHDLRGHGWIPDLALVSDATRTRETWELVAAAGNFACPAQYHKNFYHGYISEVVGAIQEADEATLNLIVVGHEPTVSATAARLAGFGSDDSALSRVRRGLSTGARATLAFSGPWPDLAPGRCQLLSVVKPRL